LEQTRALIVTGMKEAHGGQSVGFCEITSSWS
jgi:hypothetical protein